MRSRRARLIAVLLIVGGLSACADGNNEAQAWINATTQLVTSGVISENGRPVGLVAFPNGAAEAYVVAQATFAFYGRGNKFDDGQASELRSALSQMLQEDAIHTGPAGSSTTALQISDAFQAMGDELPPVSEERFVQIALDTLATPSRDPYEVADAMALLRRNGQSQAAIAREKDWLGALASYSADWNCSNSEGLFLGGIAVTGGLPVPGCEENQLLANARAQLPVLAREISTQGELGAGHAQVLLAATRIFDAFDDQEGLKQATEISSEFERRILEQPVYDLTPVLADLVRLGQLLGSPPIRSALADAHLRSVIVSGGEPVVAELGDVDAFMLSRLNAVLRIGSPADDSYLRGDLQSVRDAASSTLGLLVAEIAGTGDSSETEEPDPLYAEKASTVVEQVLQRGSVLCSDGRLTAAIRTLATGDHFRESLRAQAYRFLSDCRSSDGQSIPQALLESAQHVFSKAESYRSVQDDWEAAATICALDPKSLPSQELIWRRNVRAAAPLGGASQPGGQVDISTTYALVSLLRADADVCGQIGLLDGAL